MALIVFLMVLVGFYLFLNWSSYAILYFSLWKRFPEIRPLSAATNSTEPWLGCRRIEWVSGSMSSTYRTIYVQFTGTAINVIHRDWFFPLVPRLLGMGVLSETEVKILSREELSLFDSTENPMTVYLNDPLWEMVSTPTIHIYADGTVVSE